MTICRNDDERRREVQRIAREMAATAPPLTEKQAALLRRVWVRPVNARGDVS
ncbi:hypothetical protein [Williamsia deligens]|uniref:Uncharacterized protein n=1 Tax=Williamsia deligens TaxID=321325 RepID=A0ABW3GAL6_9NOCA|nr:hypothetical protein [Williamsia deligens]